MDFLKDRGVSLDLAETHSAIIYWIGESFDDTQTLVATTRQEMEDEVIGWLTVQHAQSPIRWISTETAVMIRNAKRYGELCRMLGNIERWCRQHNVKYFEGATTQIDSVCAIPHCKREVRKEYTRNLAEQLYSNMHFNEDECDAVVTGIWGWGKYKELMWSKEAT